MNERPILFSGEMVRAILDGRKTQTRRIMKPQPDFRKARWNGETWEFYMGYPLGHDVPACPYGESGDRLWVRETWHAMRYFDSWKPSDIPEDAKIWYVADTPNATVHIGSAKTRPSIFMCRWMSRINLRIRQVWIERVQDISEMDACAEGVWGLDELYQGIGDLPTDRFRKLWDSINAKRGYGWSSNPWVWCVEFELQEAVNDL